MWLQKKKIATSELEWWLKRTANQQSGNRSSSMGNVVQGFDLEDAITPRYPVSFLIESCTSSSRATHIDSPLFKGALDIRHSSKSI